MYQQTENLDIILDTDTGTYIPRGHYLWPEDESQIQPLPAPTLAEVIAQFVPAMQTYMDGVAQQNGYDSVMSCASYANSSVAAWKADAVAIIAWRDAMWSWAYAQQGALAAMTEPPTIADVIAQAPKATDSGWIVHAPGA